MHPPKFLRPPLRRTYGEFTRDSGSKAPWMRWRRDGIGARTWPRATWRRRATVTKQIDTESPPPAWARHYFSSDWIRTRRPLINSHSSIGSGGLEPNTTGFFCGPGCEQRLPPATMGRSRAPPITSSQPPVHLPDHTSSGHAINRCPIAAFMFNTVPQDRPCR